MTTREALQSLCLVAGVALLVANLWPVPARDGPYWSDNARAGLGLGAGLVTLGVVSRKHGCP